MPHKIKDACPGCARRFSSLVGKHGVSGLVVRPACHTRSSLGRHSRGHERRPRNLWRTYDVSPALVSPPPPPGPPRVIWKGPEVLSPVAMKQSPPESLAKTFLLVCLLDQVTEASDELKSTKSLLQSREVRFRNAVLRISGIHSREAQCRCSTIHPSPYPSTGFLQ